MAVNVGERHVQDTPENRQLYAVDKARLLVAHTIRCCINKKIFLQEYESAMTSKIVSTATNIYVHANRANNIRVNKDAGKWAERRRYEDMAIAECNDLCALLGVAKLLFHLRGKKVRYWVEMTVDTKRLLQAWRDSDQERYGRLGTG